MRAKNKTKRFNVDYTEEQHKTVADHANSAGVSMHTYVVEMSTVGKITKKRK